MTRTAVDSCLPQPGAKFQVIGAGLPRTGTNSFCVAISTLLDGPAYQAAAQSALSATPKHVLALINILKLKTWTIKHKHSQEKTATRKIQDLKLALADEMNGWVASADAPLCLLVPELLEIFPEAIVVCTVRDREKWAKSMWKAARLGNPTVLSWLYFWVPILRYSPRMWGAQGPIWQELYGTNIKSEQDALVIWDQHHQWLRDVVPGGKLFFADISEGWNPICRALRLPVPKDVPFPRLNDGEALEQTMRKFALMGILRWCAVLVGFLSLLGLARWLV